MQRKRKSRVAPIVTTDGDTTTIKTGIYQRTIRNAKLITPLKVTVGGQTFDAAHHKTPAELRADGEAWNTEPQRTLDAVRRQAIEFFSEYAIEVSDNSPPSTVATDYRLDLGNGLRWYRLPDDATPIVRDAADVLECLFLVESDATSPQYKIFYAIKLGRMYERMMVRQLEHRALAGMKLAKHNVENNDISAAAAVEKRGERRKAFGDAINRQVRNHERRSVKRAMSAAATECGCSVAAIKQARRESV